MTYERELELALEWVRKAGARALQFFEQPTPAEEKADTSPVTEADRECEKLIRGVIQDEPGRSVGNFSLDPQLANFVFPVSAALKAANPEYEWLFTYVRVPTPTYTFTGGTGDPAAARRTVVDTGASAIYLGRGNDQIPAKVTLSIDLRATRR